MRINHEINASECRLIRHDGVQYGVVNLDEARSKASELGLDLVEISPNARPPVVKLINYGKFKYDQQKKKSEAKKRQNVTQLKEVQFRPSIEAHDLETKLTRVQRFLRQGDKVKLVMQFRGREMSYKEAGKNHFADIIEQVLEMGAKVESEPKMVNNRIIGILVPGQKENRAIGKGKEQVRRSGQLKIVEKGLHFAKIRLFLVEVFYVLVLRKEWVYA